MNKAGIAVCELSKNFHIEVKDFLASGNKSPVVILYPNRVSALVCGGHNISSEPIPVRLLRIKLNSGKIEVLITSLLGETLYFTAWSGKLYQPRRSVKESCKWEKQNLEIEKLSIRTPQVHLQTFQAKILPQIRHLVQQGYL